MLELGVSPSRACSDLQVCAEHSVFPQRRGQGKERHPFILVTLEAGLEKKIGLCEIYSVGDPGKHQEVGRGVRWGGDRT